MKEQLSVEMCTSLRGGACGLVFSTEYGLVNSDETARIREALSLIIKGLAGTSIDLADYLKCKADKLSRPGYRPMTKTAVIAELRAKVVQLEADIARHQDTIAQYRDYSEAVEEVGKDALSCIVGEPYLGPTQAFGLLKTGLQDAARGLCDKDRKLEAVSAESVATRAEADRAEEEREATEMVIEGLLRKVSPHSIYIGAVSAAETIETAFASSAGEAVKAISDDLKAMLAKLAPNYTYVDCASAIDRIRVEVEGLRTTAGSKIAELRVANAALERVKDAREAADQAANRAEERAKALDAEVKAARGARDAFEFDLDALRVAIVAQVGRVSPLDVFGVPDEAVVRQLADAALEARAEVARLTTGKPYAPDQVEHMPADADFVALRATNAEAELAKLREVIRSAVVKSGIGAFESTEADMELKLAGGTETKSNRHDFVLWHNSVKEKLATLMPGVKWQGPMHGLAVLADELLRVRRWRDGVERELASVAASIVATTKATVGAPDEGESLPDSLSRIVDGYRGLKKAKAESEAELAVIKPHAKAWRDLVGHIGGAIAAGIELKGASDAHQQ